MLSTATLRGIAAEARLRLAAERCEQLERGTTTENAADEIPLVFMIMPGEADIGDLLSFVGVTLVRYISDAEGNATWRMLEVITTVVTAIHLPADPAAESGDRVVASSGLTLASVPRRIRGEG